MAIILDKYAIKEVADVMFYELDSKGAPSAPVLYLDTLKTSTLSQSSETVDATGGKGNVKILSWDTNKELTLELEDAVFSAKSLGIMFGGTMSDNSVRGQEVLKTLKAADISASTATGETDYCIFELKGQKYYIAKNRVTTFAYLAGSAVPTAVETPNWETKNFDFATFDLLDCTMSAAPVTTANTVVKNGIEINIGAEFGDNTYYITGDTYARNVASGKDEFLQFIIPKGKVSAEDVSLTMEADGDPATFAMTVNCLKAIDGTMVKLVKYELDSNTVGSGAKNKGVASILNQYNRGTEHMPWDTPKSIVNSSLTEGEPSDNTDD
jgi:hypothetical protein